MDKYARAQAKKMLKEEIRADEIKNLEEAKETFKELGFKFNEESILQQAGLGYRYRESGRGECRTENNVKSVINAAKREMSAQFAEECVVVGTKTHLDPHEEKQMKREK